MGYGTKLSAGQIDSEAELEAVVGTAMASTAELATHTGGNGSDHTYIDQDVTSGAAPTLVTTNLSGACLGFTQVRASSFVQVGTTPQIASYPNTAYGGLGAGGLHYATADGPYKLVTTGRTNSAGNRAIVVGAGVSGTAPVLDVFTIGFYDTGGPTWYDLYQFKGDGLIQTSNVTSEYMPSAGRVMVHTGTEIRTGFTDDLDDSARHAEWTDNIDAGVTGGAITETTALAMTSSSDQAVWDAGSGDTSLDASVPVHALHFRAWVHMSVGSTAGQGIGLYFYRPDTDGNRDKFSRVVLLKQGSAYNLLLMEEDDGIKLNVGDISQGTCWVMIVGNGLGFEAYYSTAAVGSEPADTGWTYIAEINAEADRWNRIPGSRVALVGLSDPGISTDATFSKFRLAYI